MATNNFFPQQLQIKYFYFAHTPMNDVKQVLASTFVKEFEVMYWQVCLLLTMSL